MKKEKNGLAVLVYLIVSLCCNNLIASTYYVDNIDGDDSFTGLTASQAWKSVAKVSLTTFVGGDSILFKANGTWSGQLYPKGSGVSGDPIVIDMYGTGDKPLIAGGGVIDYVVNLYNQQYWEINNLEITNQGTDEANRVGVRLGMDNGTTIQHIHLKNLEIHDISGRYTFELPGKHTGGISIRLLGTSLATRLNDVLIEGCEIYNIVRVGISSHSSHSTANSRLGDQPITNLIVRNNIIHHTAGDGLILRSTYKAVVENNLAYENHNANEGLVSYGVALWCRSADTTIFQFNEVYQTRGSLDGQSFDADFEAHGTIFQYNYSHDNEGGFMLIMNGVTGTVIRYNIIQNDGAIGKHVFNFSDYDPGGNPNRGIANIYNNTIYVPQASEAAIVEHATATSELSNNIIYNYGSGAADIASAGQRPVWSHNTFFGTVALPADANILTSDPKTVAPGTGGSGLTSVTGYQLRAGSPSLNSGKVIALNGGRDYFNNGVSASTAPHRGAYNGAAVLSPDVAISSPLENTHYENLQMITIEATASDPGSSVITEVEFFVDGSSIGIDVSFPYSIDWTLPATGSFVLTAKASNENFLSSISLPVNISAGTLPTCHLTIDDAEEKETTGAVDLNQTDDVRLFFDPWGSIGGQIAYQQLVGLRFNNLGIPQGAVIETAYIQFTADEPDPGSGAGTMVIKGEDADNSSAFTTSAYNISGRLNTISFVNWNPAPWSTTGANGDAQRTPELKDIIQEIIDRAGWSSNNSLALVISGTGDLKRYARSLEGSDPTNASKLCFLYSIPTGISEFPEEAKASLFPNPTSGEVTVRFPVLSSESLTLTITDVMGKAIFSRSYEQSTGLIEDKINLSPFTKGIYFVQFRQGDKVQTERLVITE